MIKKVIIAEDQESANLSVQKTMEDLHIGKSEHVYYCDDALNKIQLARQKGDPFDLLITDLYFEDDGNSQKIGGGFDLIRAARDLQPEILVLVFSTEHRPATIDMLFKDYAIDGYVRKARHDINELKMAFDALSKGQRYYPHSLVQLIRQANTYEFAPFDINIIRLLSQGYSQKEIHKLEGCSLSKIEKRLKEMRDALEFTKNEQLVLFCKEARML